MLDPPCLSIVAEKGNMRHFEAGAKGTTGISLFYLGEYLLRYVAVAYREVGVEAVFA